MKRGAARVTLFVSVEPAAGDRGRSSRRRCPREVRAAVLEPLPLETEVARTALAGAPWPAIFCLSREHDLQGAPLNRGAGSHLGKGAGFRKHNVDYGATPPPRGLTSRHSLPQP